MPPQNEAFMKVVNPVLENRVKEIAKTLPIEKSNQTCGAGAYCNEPGSPHPVTTKIGRI